MARPSDLPRLLSHGRWRTGTTATSTPGAPHQRPTAAALSSVVEAPQVSATLVAKALLVESPIDVTFSLSRRYSGPNKHRASCSRSGQSSAPSIFSRVSSGGTGWEWGGHRKTTTIIAFGSNTTRRVEDVLTAVRPTSFPRDF